MEKQEIFEHLVPSFNYLTTTISPILSSKVESTSIDIVFDKIHKQLSVVKLFALELAYVYFRSVLLFCF